MENICKLYQKPCCDIREKAFRSSKLKLKKRQTELGGVVTWKNICYKFEFYLMLSLCFIPKKERDLYPAIKTFNRGTKTMKTAAKGQFAAAAEKRQIKQNWNYQRQTLKASLSNSHFFAVSIMIYQALEEVIIIYLDESAITSNKRQLIFCHPRISRATFKSSSFAQYYKVIYTCFYLLRYLNSKKKFLKC